VSSRRALVILLAVLGVAFIAIAVYYWVTPAGSLASFVPGHLAGSAHKHLKHGLAALLAGIACLLGVWMLTGKK
jgi:hypothetical protein